MKLRHSIALVLVGWYFIVPPLVNAPYKIDTQAPLSSWKVHKKFSTEDQCNDSLAAAHAKYDQTADAPIGTIAKGSRAFALQMEFARCVSSDDPSLKGGD